MRLLVVYRGLPWPISEGYHLRVLHLFRRLARRHAVHLLGLIHRDEQAAKLPQVAAQGFFSSIRLERFPRRRWRGRARTNLGCDPVAALKAEYPGFAARLRRVALELAGAHRLQAAYVFDPWADVLFSDALVVPALLDVCDCRSLYYQRLLDGGGMGTLRRLRTRQLLRRFRGFERFLLRRYPLATVVAPPDRDYLLSLEPAARVEVIPNGVDLDDFAPAPGAVEQPGELIFFGNMDFAPNVDAACRFARDVLPLVRRRCPGARFTVAGTNPAPEVRALGGLDGVTVTGGVPDLKPWIERAALLVAPLRFGTGIKNKVLEAMAMEKPVVCSSLAASGLAPEVRALLRVADAPAPFAAAVCELLESPERRRRIGRSGRAEIARHHSWEAAAERYEALFDELAATGASR